MAYDKEFFSKSVLMPIKSKIKKHKIISFDTETHGYKNKMLICGIYTDKYHAFFEKSEAQQFIDDNTDKETYVMATNLMFDYQCLYYDTYMWDKFKVIMRNGNMLTAKYKHIRFSDTINYTHSSVKKLGEQIGIKKLGYEEMMGRVPKTKNQWKKLKQYNSYDCKITKRWTETFQDILNKLGCEMKLTIASCAMDLYRRKYMPCAIYKESIDCKEFILQSYYGGRVETFKRGRLPNRATNGKGDDKYYYWYDYNSAYPFQMLKEYPLPSSAKITKNTSIELIKKYHGCSEVTVSIPHSEYPLLPYRQDEKLLFPYGTMRAVWNHIELQRAIEIYGEKCIIKVHKTLYYTKTFHPFKKYVSTLYGLRLLYKKEHNYIMSDICKILMNSLYGKFATGSFHEITFFDFMQMTKAEIIAKDRAGIFDGMKVTDADNKGFRKAYQEYEKECDSNYILPILSSCVTSYQRVQLHKDLVNLEGLYCDTDSILTTKKIKDNMDLGGLKLEKKVTRGWLIRPKCYMIYDITEDEEGKMKGWNVKVKGIKGMTPNRFVDILNNRNIKQFKFMKIKEALTRRYTPNQKINFTKEQDIDDSKRLWSEKFNKNTLQDSEPIFINENH